MEKKNHIDKAIDFLESLERMRQQLKSAEDMQKAYIAQLLELKKDGKTDTEEYCDLSNRSKALQAQIDKYRPVYMERLEMVKDIKRRKTQN